MPTGYTADVATGKIATLRAFALQCARGMGACIQMRDEPLGAPIPARFEPDTRYYDTALAEAQRTLEQLPQLSPSECVDRVLAELHEKIIAQRTRQKERAEQRGRYEGMQSAVRAWEGSPEGLKLFMMQQLAESIRFDCGDYVPDPLPDAETGEQWRERHLAKARADVIYYQTQVAEEIARTEGRNAWLAQLWASLPAETDQ